jgi:hypothetical protein
MLHPADDEAWHAMDRFDPEFARDPRSVRLGLSTDSFQPYSSDSTAYSYWLVFLMLYNLPPNKCLRARFIFLTLVILGPKEPRKEINIFLRPLMEEIMKFWSKYFSCANNVNAHTTWYHIVEEVALTDLSIFQLKGKDVGAPSAQYVKDDEWNYTMFYM